LALAFGGSDRRPSDKIASRLFSALGNGISGRQEDHAEDVFVSLIRTPRGNFRILEGVWESSAFYLQRVVNALEFIPPGKRYDRMREVVYALLRLSDVICERANLSRYELGNQIPQEALTRKILEQAGSLRRSSAAPQRPSIRTRALRTGSMPIRVSGLSVGRIIKRHLTAAVRSDPQFLFLCRFSETAFFEDFG
jgi:hypothetical protein